MSIMTRTGTFTPCRKWRYKLTREWDPRKPKMNVIGLNPSIADENIDDPTIRRCIGFAMREGCGGLIMSNLFAWIETDSKKLYSVPAPVGVENDEYLVKNAKEASIVVAAWGCGGEIVPAGSNVARDMYVYTLLTKEKIPVMCFGTTMHGFPKHPLYLSQTTPLVSYTDIVERTPRRRPSWWQRGGRLFRPAAMSPGTCTSTRCSRRRKFQ